MSTVDLDADTWVGGVKSAIAAIGDQARIIVIRKTPLSRDTPRFSIQGDDASSGALVFDHPIGAYTGLMSSPRPGPFELTHTQSEAFLLTPEPAGIAVHRIR